MCCTEYRRRENRLGSNCNLVYRVFPIQLFGCSMQQDGFAVALGNAVRSVQASSDTSAPVARGKSSSAKDKYGCNACLWSTSSKRQPTIGRTSA